MGHRGKVEARARARELRAASWTLAEIADEVGAAKSSVSLWVRDVDFEPRPRNRGHASQRPHPMRVRKEAEIEQLRREGIARIGELTDREFLMAGLGLYAGDGAKTGTMVSFANNNPRLVSLFCRWFRQFCVVDESRLRVKLYLHEGLDLDVAVQHWSAVTGVPPSQFQKPYRAVADATMRTSRHVHGCAHVRYSDARELRRILGMLEALLV